MLSQQSVASKCNITALRQLTNTNRTKVLLYIAPFQGNNFVHG